ncbi:MAG: hypothetical protein LRY71_02130 [Bacillaceae bacterium]|nr:hypothetical protein [Bacillaceae bacterium]
MEAGNIDYYVASGDLASIADTCLLEDGHLKKSFEEVGNILSQTLGRKIKCKNPGTLAFRKT